MLNVLWKFTLLEASHGCHKSQIKLSCVESAFGEGASMNEEVGDAVPVFVFQGLMPFNIDAVNVEGNDALESS